MVEAITHSTSMIDAAELLDLHGVDRPFGWEIAIGMLLNDCHYLTVSGFGSKAVFNLRNEAVLSERSGEIPRT